MTTTTDDFGWPHRIKTTAPESPPPVPASQACKVCGNEPDADGAIHHGKGCYVVSENGGGVSYTDPPVPEDLSGPRQDCDRALLADGDLAQRLRRLIPGCDCDNPAQCWEPCGDLGHDDRHAKIAAGRENKAGAASVEAGFKAADSDGGLASFDSLSRGLPNNPVPAAPDAPELTREEIVEFVQEWTRGDPDDDAEDAKLRAIGGMALRSIDLREENARLRAELGVTVEEKP